MILLDSSAFMRNGDYIPTRWGAQHDAAQLLANAQHNGHPESTVGVAAGTQLLVSPTDDIGLILQALHEPSPWAEETLDWPAALQVASLALKHRRNKVGQQRIVCFVGSPVHQDLKALQKAGKLLKKNNVCLDVVVLLGNQAEAHTEKLQAMVTAASSDGTLVTVPAGVLPSDVLASSPILGAVGAAMGGGGGGNDFGEFGGVDPNMDPELAMALRVSMEEERARQERAANNTTSSSDEAKAPEGGDPQLSEEDALLQQALAMSMNEPDEPPSIPEEMDEDAAMQMALQMSLQQDEDESAAKKPKTDDDEGGEAKE